MAMRAAAIFGLALWIIAGVYVSTAVLSWFVNFAAPNIYVSASVVLLGFAVNVALLSGAAKFHRTARTALLLASIAMSTAVLASIIYMASG